MSKMDNVFYAGTIILGIMLFAAALGIAGTADVEEVERQQSEYCEMVQLWKDSNGEYGWPAYEGESQCRGE